MKEQIAMAEKFGYVESVGDAGANLKRGDLVPYDDVSSCLARHDVESLKARGVQCGAIYPKRKARG